MVERYEVDIPEDETDREFIKAALAATRHEDVVYLVTYDSGLLEVDLGKLSEVPGGGESKDSESQGGG